MVARYEVPGYCILEGKACRQVRNGEAHSHSVPKGTDNVSNHQTRHFVPGYRIMYLTAHTTYNQVLVMAQLIIRGCDFHATDLGQGPYTQ